MYESKRARGVGVAAMVACLAIGRRADAQPRGAATTERPQRLFVVLRVDETRVLVDVGRADAIEAGSLFRLERPVSLRHPTTGAVLRDRLLLGTVRLTSVGSSISEAAVNGTLRERPAVGDVLVPDAVSRVNRAPMLEAMPEEFRATEAPRRPVVVPTRAPAVRPGTVSAPQNAPTITTTASAPATALPPPQSFASLPPPPPPSLPPPPPARQAPPPRPVLRRQPQALLAATPPDRLRSTDPVVLAFQRAPEANVRAAVLHVRRVGEAQYQSVAMAVEGDGYLRGTVPRALVSAAGIEYFVETVDSAGGQTPAWESASSPGRIEIEEPARPAPYPVGRSRVDLRAEYADVGSRLNDRREHRAQRFTLIEGDFLQRLGDGVLYGYRVGFGVYDGRGVPLSLFDSETPTTPSTTVYGYHELEFAALRSFHIITRVQIGVHDGGVIGGGHLRLRIGQERGTNLVIGGDITQSIGQKAFFALNVTPYRRLPLLAMGEVFNQSVAGGDPMFRVVTQVGWRFTESFTLAARGSYQLRNLNNGGFGFGLSTTFDW